MISETKLCIVGGGPAGMIAGLLFARAGVQTTVLEKHGDFLRDFRGDTVHPSTLRLFSELGLLEQLLKRPHNKVHTIGGVIAGREIEFADFSSFDPRWNFTALMPQWEFLDFVADEARKYPNFTLLVNAEATGLMTQGERVTGIHYRSEGEIHAMTADLVIAADGRSSILRAESGLPLLSFGAPMDVLWFRVPKEPTAENDTTGIFAPGRILVLIDRGDYWQCAYVFAKGEVEAVRARGIEAFRREVSTVGPRLKTQIGVIDDWDKVKLLTVALDRLERWDRPGLLVIGDAAHAMSPIGGVGINVAIQDAVATANILAGPMARGEDVSPLLAKVRKRRLLAVRSIQAFQKFAQNAIITPLLSSNAATSMTVPLPLRLLGRFPYLRRFPAAFLGFGIRAEHIHSPAAAHSQARPETS